MKNILQLCLLVAVACTSVFAQEVKTINAQQPLPAPTNNIIRFEPGTAKHLPVLFTVATKTLLFLNLADEIGLDADQKAALTDIHKGLQARAQQVKLSYEQENKRLQDILNSDQIQLEDMRENLRTSEQLKAEMQYYLFEALLKATKVLTLEQKQKILAKMQLDDMK